MVCDHSTMKIMVMEWTDELDELLRGSLRRAGVTDEEMPKAIISTKELLAPIVGVCQWGHLYPDMMIVCPVDNKNACTWISKLEVDNVIGQLFTNVLAR